MQKFSPPSRISFDMYMQNFISKDVHAKLGSGLSLRKPRGPSPSSYLSPPIPIMFHSEIWIGIELHCSSILSHHARSPMSRATHLVGHLLSSSLCGSVTFEHHERISWASLLLLVTSRVHSILNHNAVFVYIFFAFAFHYAIKYFTRFF